jgi:hypothetical protein
MTSPRPEAKATIDARWQAAAALREFAETARSFGSPVLWSLLLSYAKAAERGDMRSLAEARDRLREDCRWYAENAPGTRPLQVVTGALEVILRFFPPRRSQIMFKDTRPPHLILRLVRGERRVVKIVESDSDERA